MSADPKSFHQSKLIQRKSLRFMKQPKRHRQKRLHATVDMHAKKSKVFAAIGAANPARMTFAAIDVRLDRTMIADPDAQYVFRNVGDFAGKFMAQNARVGVCGMIARQSVKVAAADTNAPDADKRLPCRGLGTWNLPFDELPGCGQHNLFHFLEGLQLRR